MPILFYLLLFLIFVLSSKSPIQVSFLILFL